MVADLTGELERTIQSGDFDRARPLIAEYASSVRQELASARTAVERENILRNALQTLNAHLYLARAIRSHIAASLQATTRQSAYRTTQRDAYTWRMQA